MNGSSDNFFSALLRVNAAGYFDDMPRVFTQRDRPDDHLLIWVLRGAFRTVIGGVEHHGRAGDLFAYAPGEPHAYHTSGDEPWAWLWVHYSGRCADAAADAIRSGGQPRPLGLDPTIRARFLELVSVSYARVGRPRRERDMLHADTCLASLLGLIIQRLRAADGLSRSAEPIDLAMIQRNIDRRLHEPITVEDLADLANYSPAHFSRVFRSLTGRPPMRYVNERRIDRAGVLLTQTTMKLSDIARAVGYDDPFYFSRVFKKATGSSPSSFRAAFGG